MSIRAARARIIATAVALASLPALVGTPAAAHDSGVRLDFLGERELPNAMAFQGTTVGGLSAISYDAKTGTYYLISDDRSQTGPARFYTAHIDFAHGALKGVELTGTHPWLRPDGTTFPPTSTATSTVAPDPEGIAVDPRDGSLAWTSEGERIVPSDGPALLGDPWIRRATTTGAYRGQLALPPQLHMDSQEFGPRKNQTLEGVTFTPDGRRIVTAMEDPLYQDGDDPTPSTARSPASPSTTHAPDCRWPSTPTPWNHCSPRRRRAAPTPTVSATSWPSATTASWSSNVPRSSPTTTGRPASTWSTSTAPPTPSAAIPSPARPRTPSSRSAKHS